MKKLDNYLWEIKTQKMDDVTSWTSLRHWGIFYLFKKWSIKQCCVCVMRFKELSGNLTVSNIFLQQTVEIIILGQTFERDSQEWDRKPVWRIVEALKVWHCKCNCVLRIRWRCETGRCSEKHTTLLYSKCWISRCVQIFGQANTPLKRWLLDFATRRKEAELRSGVVRKDSMWDKLIFNKVQVTKKKNLHSESI